MRKIAILGAVLVLLAASATYARFESFDPCVWMEHELAEESGLPRMIVAARIQAEFLMRGVGDPGPRDCLLAWWDFRAEGLRKQP